MKPATHISHRENRGLATAKTLLEHLGLDSHEIGVRKEAIGFTSDDIEALVKYKSFIKNKVHDLVESFYERELRNKDVDLLIGDSGTAERLRASLFAYIKSLFSGKYGIPYFESRARIGAVHNRLGVGPKFFLPAIGGLKKNMLEVMASSKFGKGSVEAASQALEKLIILDTSIIFDTHINALEMAAISASNRVKEHANRLEAAVRERTSEIESLTKIDSLTGVTSHAEFYSEFESLRIRQIAQEDAISVIAFIDVDDFKQVNDKRGHREGNKQLVGVAHWLSALFGGDVLVGRIGGDEFCMYIQNQSAIEAKEHISGKLDLLQEGGIEVSLSIGLVEYTHQNCDIDSLIASADKAMYKAKGTKEPKDSRTTRVAIGDLIDKTTGKLLYGRRVEDCSDVPE